MVLMMSPVQGATVEELEDQIADLLAQIEALQDQLAGTPAAAACTFTRNLYPGMSGADVKCLQEYLNGAGYPVAASGAGSAGNETEYYGSLTQAAVGAWQDANGVAYGAYKGYFGPVSQAKFTAVAPAEEEEEEEEEALEGGAGAINDADYVSSLNNEEVGEDEEDVEVAGLELEVDDSSDIMITAVNLNFSQGTAGSDFEDYAEEVSVLVDDVEYARVDGDDFTDDNNYDRTVSLDSGAIIKAGEKGDLVVAVSGISNLDTADAGDTWTLEFESVRFKDGQGAVISDNATGDINDGVGRTFSLETYATAADIELKISKGDETINDAHVLNLDDTNDTDDVEIFAFETEIEGSSDIYVDEIAVEYDYVPGGTGHLDDVISAVHLLMDNEEVGTENMTDVGDDDNETVTFDDLDLTLEAEETYEFVVAADFNAIDGAIVEDGDTVAANIGAIERGLIDAEDESGEDLTDGTEMTGTATGDAHAIYDAGITVSLKSVEIEKTLACDGVCAVGEAEQAQAVITLEVDAFDADAYVEDSIAVATGSGAVYTVNGGAAPTVVDNLTSSADLDATTTAYEILEGTSETFTVTVNITADAPDFFNVAVTEIDWGATVATSDDNVYDFNLDDFETDYIYLNQA